MNSLLAGVAALLIVMTHTLQAGIIPPVEQDTNTPATSNRATALESGISRNWAGYAATGGKFTSVSGTWSVPTITDTSVTGADATWVGIGGVRSDDLIQAGTQAIVDPWGRVSYSAFYETLPDASVSLGLSIHSGDSITIAITQQGGNKWRLRVQNTTTGEINIVNTYYPSSFSSAEWIEEAPTGTRRQIPLDNFGSISISSASTIKNGQTLTPSDAQARPIAMGNEDGATLASPSVLDSDGASFTVSRTTTTDVAEDQPRIIYLIARRIPFLIHPNFHFGE